jgi:hypothetical protein
LNDRSRSLELSSEIDSAIARAITGTAWSGPRFFALKLSGDRGNDPPDTAHDRGAARITSRPNHPQGEHGLAP